MAPVDLDELLTHAGWVRALARSLSRDHESAEDLVQETWLAALRRPPRRGPDLRGWLARVLTNSARRHERTERRRRDRESLVQGAGTDPMDGLIVQADEQQRIGRLVLTLDEPYRSVILLHYWRGETPSRIARRTGRSPATVRSQLSRGRAELRRALVYEYGGEARNRAGLLAAAGPSLPWLLPVTRGVLVMNLSKPVWICVAVVALLLAGAGWRVLGSAGQPQDTVESPASLSLELDDPFAAVVELTSTTGTGVRAEIAASSESSGLAPANTEASVVARFVDSQGRPVSGVALRSAHDADAARSDADGEVELIVDASGMSGTRWPSRPIAFLAECEGYVTRSILATPTPAVQTDLGELVLERGGSLSGVVVDREGTPLDGIRIVATGAALQRLTRALKTEGPGTALDTPSTVSIDGSFVIAGVPPGHARLWARAERTGWVASEPIAVTPGEETGGLQFVLHELAREDLILGVVRDPEGNPISSATVWAKLPFDRYGLETTFSDENGRFEIIVEARGPHDLQVFEYKGRWRPTTVRGVEPGSREITVVLTAPRWIRLTVLNARTKEPLAEPWITTHGEDKTDKATYDPAAGLRLDKPGVGEHWVRVPAHAFTVRVRRDGYVDLDLGPFDPGSAPLELEARLTPMGVVSGRVTSEGEPVVGAEVQLLPIASNRIIHSFGFRMRVDPFGDEFVESTANGTFSISVDEPGLYRLVVHKAGLAVGESDPLAIDPHRDMPGMDIALIRGGAIEGVIQGSPGKDLSGKVVAASRGDGDVRFVRADESGTYRFEHLAPGGWQVAHRDSEGDRNDSSQDTDEEPPPIEWDCEVVNGRTTRHDIALRDTTLAVLRGQLLIDDGGPAGWSASFVRETGIDPTLRTAALEADGRFELKAPAGAWRLVLRSPFDIEPELLVLADVTLGEEPLDWSTSITTGTLWGTSEAGATKMSFAWRDESGTSCKVTFTPATNGAFEVVLPAGTGELQREWPLEPYESWERLRFVEIPAGGAIRVDLP